MAEAALLFAENVLQLVGAIVVSSIASVAYRGYRETGSPTLLRLTTSFALLTISFLLSGVFGLTTTLLLPDLTVVALTVALISAASLETAGYFFLFFSHVLNVRGVARLGLVPVIIFPAATAALKSLSLYFLMYGFIETLLAYGRGKKRETLLIASALGLLATAEFVRFVASFYPGDLLLNLATLLVKIVSFAALSVPVLRFSLHSGGNS